MKGLIVTSEHRVELVEDIPFPDIGDYDALIQHDCCIICNGTDNEIINGNLEEIKEYPVMLGHESAGRVVQIGNKVRNYHIGDMVVRSTVRKNTKYNSGWGAFSEYGVAVDYFAMESDGYPDRNKFTIGMMQRVYPQGITELQAALMITLKEVCSAFYRIGIKSEDRILIVGDGPVALCMTAWGKVIGLKEIVMLGQNPFTMPIAKQLGATIVFDNNNYSEKESLFSQYKGSINHYIDTVGLPATIQQGLPFLVPDGMISVYGLRSGNELHIPLSGIRNFGVRFIQWPIHIKEGSVHEEVCRAVLEKRLDPDKIISHVLPIEDYQKGFDLIKQKLALKVALVFNKSLMKKK
jgi:threonine dehydrogenase-like Zn-dependent dehydrogenase